MSAPLPVLPSDSTSRSVPRVRIHRRDASAARRRIVLAVVTDSLEDVAVARRAAEIASAQDLRLVLAVPMPGEGVLIERDLPGLPGDRSLPADARGAVGRVRPVLDAAGVAYTVMPVPFRDRGGARRYSRRIAAALLRTARMLDAEQVVVGEFACWQPAGGPTVAFRLAAAEGGPAAGGARIAVVMAEPRPVRQLTEPLVPA